MQSSHGARYAVCIVLTAWFVGEARAAPTLDSRLAVTHRGSCPTRRELTRALRKAFRVHKSSTKRAWRLRVGRVAPGPLVLSLLDPNGAESLNRTIASADCGALPDAVVIILKAHFINLALPPHLNPIKGVTVAAPEPRPRRQVWIGLSGSGQMWLEPVHATADGVLEVGALPFSTPFGARIRGSVGHPIAQERDIEEVRVRPFRVFADMLLRLRFGHWWLQPHVGAGVGIHHAAAVDLPNGRSVTRVHPVIGSGLSVGYRVTGWLVLVSEVGFNVFPTADQYAVVPGGEVARSPRVTLDLGLGFHWIKNL